MLMTSPATEKSRSEATDPDGQLKVALAREKTLGYSAAFSRKKRGIRGVSQ